VKHTLVRYDRTPSALFEAKRDVRDLCTQGPVPGVVLTRDGKGVVFERGRCVLRALAWTGRAQPALRAELIAFGNVDSYTDSNAQNDVKLGDSTVRSGNPGVLVGQRGFHSLVRVGVRMESESGEAERVEVLTSELQPLKAQTAHLRKVEPAFE
jgi:hypothetical protein